MEFLKILLSIQLHGLLRNIVFNIEIFHHCMRTTMRRLTTLLGIFFSTSAFAAETAVDYVRDIKPPFSERCYACHSSLKRKNGLRLDAGQLIHKGGKAGPAVVVGKPDESPLMHAVLGTHDMEIMPPEGSPLTADQIAMLRQWIES